jgi:hypothetical protein
VSTVPDVLAPGLRVVFCGINPGRVSAAARTPFANPRNDFWRLLHAAGLTPRLLEPHEFRQLPDFGIGLTNAARRTTRGSGACGRVTSRALASVSKRSRAPWSRRSSPSSARLRIRARFGNAPTTACRSDGSSRPHSSCFRPRRQRTPPSRGTSGFAGFVHSASCSRAAPRREREPRPSRCRSSRASPGLHSRRRPSRGARARRACRLHPG